MQELTSAHKARRAIRAFKTAADALALRGYFKPSGRSGQTLEDALRTLCPEIYGTMNHPRSTELKGLEYVLDRLPRGIEECTRIILTAHEEFDQTAFEKIIPPKRRRICYRVSPEEMCFVITRGTSEIYDILTHLTFLNIEAGKICNQIKDAAGNPTVEWQRLEKAVQMGGQLAGKALDQAIWNLSIIIGRNYQETRDSFVYLEKGKKESEHNSGLFQVVYGLGKRMETEKLAKENELIIYFTPALQDMVGHHEYSPHWAQNIHRTLAQLDLLARPVHVISANLHSVVNLLYGYAATGPAKDKRSAAPLYDFIQSMAGAEDRVLKYAHAHGLHSLPDTSGMNIDCQIIDCAKLKAVRLHPELKLAKNHPGGQPPVLLVIDYAFGVQAYEIMDELLAHLADTGVDHKTGTQSISIMGKAGILPGKKGDIMLATAHVMEGTPHNYIVSNDLKQTDFEPGIDVYTGPMVTVLGTSLQNRDVLEKFQSSSWRTIGLEMEGGHYQRAISAAIIRGHIHPGVKVRYAYYASDNPMLSGQTLATGSMGKEGIRPTYMITKVILQKIMGSGK